MVMAVAENKNDHRIAAKAIQQFPLIVSRWTGTSCRSYNSYRAKFVETTSVYWFDEQMLNLALL